MESILQEFISRWGAFGVILFIVAIFGYQELKKRDKSTDERFNDLKEIYDERIEDLKNDIAVMRDENREEKKLFRDSLDCFKQIANELPNMSRQIDDLKNDVSYIKNNLNK